MTPEQLENRPRLVRDSPRGVYESWFLKANEPSGRRALWLRFTLLSPTGRPAEALAETWAILFDRERGRHRAAKESHALASASVVADPFRVGIGDSFLETGRTVGAIESGEGPVRWDLTFTTRSFLHRPFPYGAMYAGKLPKHKLVTPYPDETFTGFIAAGDDRVEVGGWPGMQGHNWGTEHTHLYAWCHCNVLGAPGRWFEGLSGRVKIGPVVLPFLSLATLALDGRRIHFDEPSSIPRAHAAVERTTRRPSSGAAPGWGYRFAFRKAGATLEGEVAADRDDLVGLAYQNPAGPVTHCLNSKTARLTLTLREGSASPIRLESEAAALEVGTRRTDHGIRMAL